MQIVDVAFRVHGTEMSNDHGYLLFSAISRLIPSLHEAAWLGIHPITGAVGGSRPLKLKDHASLQLRMPITRLGYVQALAGSTLQIGAHTLRVAASPSIHFLQPSASLSSRVVLLRLSKFNLASDELPGPALFDRFLAEAR